MSNILEQVGITKEELIERIVEKALGITAEHKQTGEETWEEIPLSSVVDEKINSAIGDFISKMEPFITKRIEIIMDEQIEAVFNKPFQKVNNWGEKKGEVTTIKDIIYDDAKKYWTLMVDKDGRETNGYGDKFTRAEFYARKVMQTHYEKELEHEVKKMSLEMKQKIPQTIAQEITKTIVGYLK